MRFIRITPLTTIAAMIALGSGTGLAHGTTPHNVHGVHSARAVANPDVMSMMFADTPQAFKMASDFALEAQQNGECVELTPMQDTRTHANKWWLHSCEEN